MVNPTCDKHPWRCDGGPEVSLEGAFCLQKQIWDEVDLLSSVQVLRSFAKVTHNIVAWQFPW